MGWEVMHKFRGNPDWEKLNRLIRAEDGNPEPFFESEDAYKMSVKEGFVRFDGKFTTVWHEVF